MNSQSLYTPNTTFHATVIVCPVLSTSHLSEKWEVRITPTFNGEIRESIVVETGSRKRPRIEVPVLGRSISSAGVRPDRLVLGRREAGEEVGVVLTIAAFERSRLTTVKVSDVDNWEVLRFSEHSSPSGEFIAEVTVRLPSVPGFHKATLVIVGTSVVVVPVSCLIER